MNTKIIIVASIIFLAVIALFGAWWFFGSKKDTSSVIPPPVPPVLPQDTEEPSPPLQPVPQPSPQPAPAPTTQTSPPPAPAPVPEPISPPSAAPPPSPIPPPPPPPPQAPMAILSSAFAQNGVIPAQYTCDSQDINPPLTIANVPSGTQSLALTVDDPDAPGGTASHWLVWNISPATSSIAANSVPSGARQGLNYDGSTKYLGPCPPLEDSKHHYIFNLYALDLMLSLQNGATKGALEAAMAGHIVAQAQLTGLYGYN